MLELFWTFFKIGLFTFGGGYAMIAQVKETVVEKKQWMTEDELVQEIMDERARELAFEGHRWYDLRRTTQPALVRNYDGQAYTLQPAQYTMRFPSSAVSANPEIERWEN